MELYQAPCWGSFTFNYKEIRIYVPTFLNNVARYKPNSFWDWLVYKKYPNQTHIVMSYANVVEEENASSSLASHLGATAE